MRRVLVCGGRKYGEQRTCKSSLQVATLVCLVLLAGCGDPAPMPPEWVTQEDER